MGMRQRKSKAKPSVSAAKKQLAEPPDGDWDKLLSDEALPRAQPSWHQFPTQLLAACSVSALVLYFNANSNEWSLDDFSAVVNNKDVRGESSVWPGMFMNDFWGTPLSSESSHKSYRPMTVLNFRANAAWCGGTEGSERAHCFHRWNWVLYALCVLVAVYALGSVGCASRSVACVIPKKDAGRKKQTPLMQQIGSSTDWYIMAASLVFTFHPIHTEAVASVVGRADILSGMLSFLAFICHRRCLDHRIAVDKRRMSGISVALYAATIFLSWVASLCKETGITTLAVCGVQEIAMILIPALTVQVRQGRQELKMELLPSLARLVGLALAGIAYLLLRSNLMGSTEGFSVHVASFLDNPLLFAPTTICRVLTALHIQAMYAWRLLWPFNLSCEYGFDVIPLIHGINDIRNVLTLTWALGLAILVVLGTRRAACSPQDSRILVSLAWIAAPLLPASHVVGIGTVLAERLLFMPSLGYAMLFGVGVDRWIRGPARDDDAATARRNAKIRINVALLILAVILLSFGAQVSSRNTDWVNNRSLWEATYSSHPSNVKISHALSNALMKEGDAIGAYKISHDNYNRLKALSPEQRSGIAQLYVYTVLAKSIVALSKAGMEGMTMEYATSVLDEAAAIAEARNHSQKHDFSMYLTRAELLAQSGDLAEARTWSEKAWNVATKVNPQEPDPVCLHGTLLMSTGSGAEGVPLLQHCIQLWESTSNDESKYVDAIENLGKAYISSKMYDRAEEFLSRAMTIREKESTKKFLALAKKMRQAQEDKKAEDAGDAPISD